MEKVCAECGQSATRLRKERCNACYMRLYRGGGVQLGSTCASCGERRAKVLSWTVLEARQVVLCGNCSFVLASTRPRLTHVGALAQRAAHERRRAERRRSSVTAPVERRLAPRRRADRTARKAELDLSTD